MGLGGRPTSTDGFILGPSHGTVGRLAFLESKPRTRANRSPCILNPKALRERLRSYLLNFSL
jgi:hypothetical protein